MLNDVKVYIHTRSQTIDTANGCKIILNNFNIRRLRKRVLHDKEIKKLKRFLADSGTLPQLDLSEASYKLYFLSDTPAYSFSLTECQKSRDIFDL